MGQSCFPARPYTGPICDLSECDGSGTMTPTLPDFERPPVVQVALSLQLRPLELLRSAHLGLLVSVFRSERFPRIEDRGELEPVFEAFDA